jgi:beta-galactosidase
MKERPLTGQHSSWSSSAARGQRTRRGGLLAGLWCLAAVTKGLAADPPSNLALMARASAFETYQGMSADLANDGRTDTRWSGIPGHNTGGWYELDWDQPVRIGEVVVFQYDRYVKELDVQVWDGSAEAWVTLQHLGRPDERLPKVVACRWAPRSTKRLRLANITNGPSFSEVEVFAEAFSHPPALNLASDANGHFIGMVSDEWGSAPVVGAQVSLSGQAALGAWQASVRSDEHGLFFAPMPVGLKGQLAATVGAAKSDVPQTTVRRDAVEFQYGLTPANLHRQESSLSGQWRFAVDPPGDFWRTDFDDHRWADIRVPAHFEMEGFRSLDGVGGYRKWFDLPAGGGRLKLRFDGVYSGAEVWINGQRLAYHEGGALPFEVDITDAVRKGDNLLAVRVTQHTVVSDQFDKMSEYADFALAGIMRPVYLFRVPAAHMIALEVVTTFDAAYRDATVAGSLAVLNESSEPLSNGAVEIRLMDPEGKLVQAATESRPVHAGPWERASLPFSLPVTMPKPWEAEHPRRYTLELTLKTSDQVKDQLAQRIGFRQTEIRGRQLRINGQPVKIRGTCHHDSHPLMGRAVTAELTRQDLELMKEANLNSLRTSHYPPLPALLDIADELGVYVEDEGSFCWAEGSDDLRLTPRLMQLNAELLARDRNHPSVFLWSVCNESAFGYGFERSHEWLRLTDPSRPNAGSYDRGSLEVHAQHNPITLAGITELEKVNKPVLWDESWCIFQGIFGDVAEMWIDPGVRDYYAVPLPAIYARMMRSENIAGSQIWAWSDDIFCVPHRGLEYGRGATPCHFIENAYRLPDRGLVGDAPWGVVDGWRRKKPEYWITKKLHSPVKLKEGPLPLPSAGLPIRVAVENQYDFTDLSELTIRWQLGGESGSAHASIPPHTEGAIEIEPTHAPKAGDVLALEFFDAQGRQVDAYRFPFGHARLRMPVLRGSGSTPLRILRENLLSGPGIRVVGQDFELAFDQASGRLRRAVGFGQVLLLECPLLQLLPAASPNAPLPNRLTWQLRQLRIEPEGTNVRVKIEGGYDHFDGSYDLLLTPTGELTTQAAFRYSGEKLLAREIGLGFSVPKDCDLLRWERQGDWSVYPDDHIGRPFGETRAFAAHAEGLPPTWPWAADNSPMGCNDFRGTKRHIYWASISYPDGPGVWVDSDGSQHARAIVESDRISIRINDWYGGTYAGLGEWTSNYGEGKPVIPGQMIESNVHLRLARMEKTPPPSHTE